MNTIDTVQGVDAPAMARRVLYEVLYANATKTACKYPELGDCWIWNGAKSGSHAYGYGKLQYGGREHKVYAHRLMFQTVHPNIPDKIDGHKAVVRHRCDTMACIRPDHLIHGIQADNVLDMVVRGEVNYAVGEAASSTKLRASQVLEIRYRADKGETYKSLAIEFGVTNVNVGSICTGDSWHSVGGPLQNKRVRMTLADLTDIRHRIADGKTNEEIANLYFVTTAHIQSIRVGVSGLRFMG